MLEKKEWNLTQQAFDKLLLQLHPNRESAAKEYESVRVKLVKFFEYRSCAFAEEYADETINRVVKKIELGEVIEKPSSYFLAVAQNLFKEYKRKGKRAAESIETIPYSALPTIDPLKEERLKTEVLDQEQLLERLRNCLSKLPLADRELIMNYYENSGKVGIENRKLIAQATGLSLSHLRIRIHRLRAKLEECIKKKMA
ncbi:MAG: RNA polymerase sigma factor [Blastocatellia bacterium]|nr:RNA polymerase sigma factor [Blastocatellia bacterium]